MAKERADQHSVDEKASFDDLVDSQGERLSQGLVFDDGDEGENDSDWEEGGVIGLGGEGVSEEQLPCPTYSHTTEF